MATSDVQYDPIDAKGPSPETEAPSNPDAQATGVGGGEQRLTDGYSLLNRAFYVAAGVAGIGMLIVLFGAYALPKLSGSLDGENAVLAGAIIVTVGIIAWVAAAVVLIVWTIKDVARALKIARTKQR